MKNTTISYRNSSICYGNITKINPYKGRNRNYNNNLKNISLKNNHYMHNSTREFGKEIKISNLTTYNNIGELNKRKIFKFPNNQNIKKENQINKTQIFSKKDNKNSVNNKPKNSNRKISMKKYSNEKMKKANNNIIRNRNISQKKNIFQNNSTISVNENIVIKDENKNPNIRRKFFSTILDMKSDKRILNTRNKNVQNVDDYFNEIANEFFSTEKNYLVNPDYMFNQSDINHRMRAILIDWLIDVHLKYKLLPQTLYLTVNIIDRYLSKNDTHRSKLQLVGIAAMFIACKYEEIYPPKAKDFVYITDGAYTKPELINMEYKMLKSLEFNITCPTQWSFLEIYGKKLDLDEKNKTFKLAWFLMELCLINYKSMKFKMSVLAGSAIFMAWKNLGIYVNRQFYNKIGIDEHNLKECCKEIYEFNEFNKTHSLHSIRRKFSLVKFDEVAKIEIH